jgi:hypothetical protein
MKLDFFMLADSAERVAHDKISIVGAIVTNAEVEAVPAQVSLTTIARLMIDDEDLRAREPFEFFVGIIPPEGDALRSTPLMISPSELPLETDHPDEERSVIVIGDFKDLPLRDVGIHRLNLVLNNEVLAERVINVSLAPTADAPEAGVNPTKK